MAYGYELYIYNTNGIYIVSIYAVSVSDKTIGLNDAIYITVSVRTSVIYIYNTYWHLSICPNYRLLYYTLIQPFTYYEIKKIKIIQK